MDKFNSESERGEGEGFVKLCAMHTREGGREGEGKGKREGKRGGGSEGERVVLT